MKRVLIAGSDVILREMIFSLVADLSVEVQVADSIAIFERECRAGHFDLVIMTDLAPFFDGTDPSAILKRAELRRPEIFVVSWQHSEWSVMSLLESRVAQYVTLPMNVRRIRRKICEYMNCKL